MSSTISPQHSNLLAASSKVHETNARFGTVRFVPAGLGVLLSAIFIWFYLLPLWHTDLWGHLSYGRVIWEAGRIPDTEPLMPLAADVPFAETAWLSKVGGYLAITIGGTTALHLLYALSITICVGLLMLRVFQQTRNAIAASVAAIVFLWVNWQQLQIIRPQLAGLVCYVMLFVLLTKRRWTIMTWLAIPAIFVSWVNLHGSFSAGLVLIASFALGAALESAMKQKSLVALFTHPAIWRYWLSGLIAMVAIAINPYGLSIFENVWRISSDPNLQDLIEWQPLTLRLKQGQSVAIVVSLLILTMYFSRKRISVTQLILLFGWGAAAMWTSRMILWWAPPLAYSVALQLHAWTQEHADLVESRWAERWNSVITKLHQPERVLWWLCVSGLLLILFWVRSPNSFDFGNENSSLFERGYSAQTPIGIANYFKDCPPAGIVLNTYEFGDYLIWAGPRDLQVFVASHAHLVPRHIWQDYLTITRLRSGWSHVLEKYSINHVAINKYKHRGLMLMLSRQADWQQVYEDDWGIVFQRTVGTK